MFENESKHLFQILCWERECPFVEVLHRFQAILYFQILLAVCIQRFDIHSHQKIAWFNFCLEIENSLQKVVSVLDIGGCLLDNWFQMKIKIL